MTFGHVVNNNIATIGLMFNLAKEDGNHSKELLLFIISG